MLDLVFLFIGFGNAAVSILILKRLRLEGWLYATTLGLLPLIYVAFGYLGDSPDAMTNELLFGVPFFAVCALQLLVRHPFVTSITGFFWLLHGVYDLTHDVWFVNPGVWFWYPAFCAGFDIAIGGYLLRASRLPGGANLSRHSQV